MFSSHYMSSQRNTWSFMVVVYLTYRYQIYFSVFIAVSYVTAEAMCEKLRHHALFFFHAQKYVVITSGSGIK